MPPQVEPAPLQPAAGGLSLRLKFILALGSLSFLPFFFISLHLIASYDSLIGATTSAIPSPEARALLLEQAGTIRTTSELLAAVVFLLIGIGTYFAERFFTGEIRTLLAWIREARTKNFQNFTAFAPVLSEDEIGQLGKEMRESIVYFQNVEAREKQIVEQKSEFISVAAHQMRTPLTGLRWGIERLLATETGTEERKKLGVGVYATAERMISLVDDLLDVAKLEDGKFGYKFRKADVVSLIKKLIAHFDLIAKSRNIAVNLEAPDLQEVYADPDRIETVISNLVSNALDYTKESGSVTISLKDEGNRIRLAVKDTGIGIPGTYVHDLFNKFSRADNAVRMRPDGSGLGLYIVRNIVEKHGSKIDVDSKEGVGSTFSFTLPKKEADLVPQGVSVKEFFEKF